MVARRGRVIIEVQIVEVKLLVELTKVSCNL